MCVRTLSALLTVFLLAAPPALARCGAPPPESPPVAVDVGSATRGLIVAVPTGYDPVRPHALVLAFHGRTNSNAEVRRYYGLEEAAREPAIFVYPAGTTDPSGRYVWNIPGDFNLFDRIVEVMSKLYCIDPERGFVAGHSLGASFANTLACARGAAIRGVATVGGGIGPAGECSGPGAAQAVQAFMQSVDGRRPPPAGGLLLRSA